MAITSGMCNSAKVQFLTGSHTPSHTYMMALYTNAATMDPQATTVYSTTNETTGTGYTAGGQKLVGFAATASAGTAYLDWTTDPAWAAASITARGAMIYNTSGSQAVALLDFGQDYTATSGTFTVTLPAPGAAAIIRIA